MVIGVTGGCGYIGSVLLPKLTKHAKRIEVLDLAAPEPALVETLGDAPVSFHQMDVADPKQFGPRAKQYDTIIHLAGLVGYPACDKDPDLAVRNNVQTTQTILDTKRKDAGVFYSSTCSNYGAQEDVVTEDTPVNPSSWHGKTKVRAEKLVLEHPENIVFRFVSAFGKSPHTRDDLLLHDFVRQAVQGNRLSVYQSEYIRQFVHVSDMTDAICFIIEHWDEMQGEVYNIGNPAIELSKQDLVKEIARHTSFEYSFENTGEDKEKRNYPVRFDKVMSYGFRPKIELKAGIAELVKYYRQKLRPTRPNKRTKPTLTT